MQIGQRIDGPTVSMESEEVYMWARRSGLGHVDDLFTDVFCH